ncbi:MAG TPA: gluconate 2-dehydrogenase subunit 3 family protein [Longimicrobiales bacterium]
MPAASESPDVLAPVRPTFRAVASIVAPATAALDEAGWQRVEDIVEHALAERPARMRRQLVVFIRLIDGLALARHRRRFRSLDHARATRLLESLQDSPVLLLRRGFWGLRTLVYMGWYAQPETARRIGYQGHVRGWPARPGIDASTPLPAVPPAHDVGPLQPRNDA